MPVGADVPQPLPTLQSPARQTKHLPGHSLGTASRSLVPLSREGLARLVSCSLSSGLCVSTSLHEGLKTRARQGLGAPALQGTGPQSNIR